MRRLIFVTAAAIVLSGIASGEPLSTVPLPIETIAREPEIASVSLSPDGEHIAALIVRPDYQWPVMAVWDTKDTTKAPSLIRALNSHPYHVAFLGNRHLLFQVDKPVGENRLARRWKQNVATDFLGTKFEYPFEYIGGLQDVPYMIQAGNFADPNRYLLTAASGNAVTFDVETFKIARYARAGRNAVGNTTDNYILADIRDGELMIRENVRPTSNGWFVYREIRNRKTGAWEEHPELGYPVKDRRVVDPLGFHDPDPNKLFVSTNVRSNFAAIWVYDIATRRWEDEPALASNQTDIFDAWPGVDWESKRVLGLYAYTTRGLSPKTTFMDDKWASVQHAVEARFPGQNVTFAGASRTTRNVVVTVSGPKLPPTYYLLKDGGQLALLGKSRPWIDPSKLGDTVARDYTARDGLALKAFVTLPPGYQKTRHGKIPLVVLPHGGPWSRDDLDWDDTGWPQILATRGYAVVQPQFRGSEGWGESLWKAGDRQWGLKMQDDLDDAVAWLVADGIADPERVAMFGYSYGGYAAVVATMRGKPLYRCAIAGAPVARVARTAENIGRNRIARELQGWTLAGYEPLDHIADMSIPLMLFHGTHDVSEDGTISSDILYAAMKRANKNVVYHEIKGMWHSGPWYPEWKRETLQLTEQYLAGPNCFGK